jgi:translation initiation factor eIF-2B subunit beta
LCLFNISLSLSLTLPPAVKANGGLVAPSGSNMVALAAKQNSVPVVTVAGMFKLCPMYPHEGQDTLNDLISPSTVIDYRLMGDPVLSEVEFANPVHDYIPPQLIDLIVTNIGGFQPSYIYRLLAECYHSDDWEAFE